MQRPFATILLFGLSAALPACASRDRAIFDEFDARRAVPGDRAAVAAAEAPPAGDLRNQPAIPIEAGPIQAGMPVGRPDPMTMPPLPRNAAPAPQVAGLEFLTGRWIAINQNKTVNEEIWSPPRGNGLLGSFRQILVDGDCSFVDLSQISIDGDEIVLRLRHLQGRLEAPEGPDDVKLFRLVSLTKDRVEFSGTAGAASVTSVVYQRMSPTVLEQSVDFSTESGQNDFVTHYVLDR